MALHSNRGPRIIEWYRADPWPSVLPILFVGPPLLTLGGVIIAVSFLTHQPREIRMFAAFAGFALIAGGALFTVIAMHLTLRDDTYIALRTDGLAVRSSGRELLIAWEELEQTCWNPARHELVLVCKRGGDIVLSRPFARIGGQALAARVAAFQRKIAMNLIR